MEKDEKEKSKREDKELCVCVCWGEYGTRCGLVSASFCGKIV